ncbi:IS1182 family transposase [Streptomyces sp. NPDC058572]|uniref:IS1182 family transposase n=1 Tax=Streptomyces sp. NPDC058572 TaxID=3346546 RepID=UPI003662C14C
MSPRSWPEPSPEIAAAVRKIYARKEPPLAVAIRDQLPEVFPDTEFSGAFGTRGRPALSPGLLALVTVLQMTENLTDRQAADAARKDLTWKYALGLGLADEGFDASVLSEFRARMVEHGLEERALDLLLAALKEKGLVKAGGKQRTDSTYVISAVRDLNRLELAGESVRAVLEALAAAAPGWLATVVDIEPWSRRYAARIDSWRLPATASKRADLAVAFGTDAVALLEAVYRADAPAWLRELPAVQVLRTVLVQNYQVTDTPGGREVRRREADEDGLPPARVRLGSPYDTDARWAAKGEDLFWLGYKIHLSETCDADDGDTTPNLITNVATTDATVADASMTEPIHQALAGRQLTPGEHYVDSGYPSAALVASSLKDFGTVLISPLLGDCSPQARAGAGYDRAAFAIDFGQQNAVCPQGRTSSSWSPCTQRGTEAVVIKFAKTTCQPCPARDRCTTSKAGYRQLTVLPRQLHELQHAARLAQATRDWQHEYRRRAGVEGTVRQAVAVTGTRRARYRGLARTHLEHVYSAVALNIVRLHAWWNGHPMDRTRTSHLARLELALAA